MATKAGAKASGLPSAKAASEARAKGMTGARKRSYVGGAVQRAKQEKADKPAPVKPAVKRQPAKKAAKAAPAKPVVGSRSKLVFGKPPKEPKAKREPGGYTPKAQALVDAYWREHEAERAGKPRPPIIISSKYHKYDGGPEHALWLYDKKQYEKFQAEKFARLRREEDEDQAERKRLEAFKDNSLVTRARADTKARAQLEKTRRQLKQQDAELTQMIDSLEGRMRERVMAQHKAERAGDTANVERLKKEALNIAQGRGRLIADRHALRIRRDNLLDSGYLPGRRG